MSTSIPDNGAAPPPTPQIEPEPSVREANVRTSAIPQPVGHLDARVPQFIGGLSVRPRQVEGGAPATLAHRPQWQMQSRIPTGRYTNRPVGTLINSRIHALRAAEPTPLNFDAA